MTSEVALHARATVIHEAAPAKLNLDLHLRGRRDDGYHLLDSIVSFTELGDVLTFEPAASWSLVIDGPFASALEAAGENLVAGAADRLAHLAGIQPRARVRLTKNLPIASGIGGGSADAAAALRGLCRLWRLQLNTDQLSDLALALGADVLCCLESSPQRLQGIGERLSPVQTPAAAILLLNPGVAVATADVFRAADLPAGSAFGPAEIWRNPTIDGETGLPLWLLDGRNDLTEPATRLCPEVGDAIASLEKTGAVISRMSGSGATCFGLFASDEACHAAERLLRNSRPDWWCQATRLAPVL
ncbi:MAG: 4-(cytidine 5'-diphospho)-2-C-methyl-D-erythritol kinase [Geminicoccaceae bacterium]